jgi:hypothetical protein
VKSKHSVLSICAASRLVKAARWNRVSINFRIAVVSVHRVRNLMLLRIGRHHNKWNPIAGVHKVTGGSSNALVANITWQKILRLNAIRVHCGDTWSQIPPNSSSVRMKSPRPCVASIRGGTKYPRLSDQANCDFRSCRIGRPCLLVCALPHSSLDFQQYAAVDCSYGGALGRSCVWAIRPFPRNGATLSAPWGSAVSLWLGLSEVSGERYFRTHKVRLPVVPLWAHKKAGTCAMPAENLTRADCPGYFFPEKTPGSTSVPCI